MDQKELDAALAASPAERITEGHIRSRIRDVAYYVLPGTTMTTCAITLDNGYTSLGESACANPENFNKEIGEKLAYERAFNKLWPFFGFLLCEKNRAVKARRSEIDAQVLAAETVARGAERAVSNPYTLRRPTDDAGSVIQFHGDSGREIFRMAPNAKGEWDVVLAEGVTWSDAALTFWGAVNQYRPQATQTTVTLSEAQARDLSGPPRPSSPPDHIPVG